MNNKIFFHIPFLNWKCTIYIYYSQMLMMFKNYFRKFEGGKGEYLINLDCDKGVVYFKSWFQLCLITCISTFCYPFLFFLFFLKGGFYHLIDNHKLKCIFKFLHISNNLGQTLNSIKK